MAFTNKEYSSRIRSRERRYHREWALRKWESAMCGSFDFTEVILMFSLSYVYIILY